MATSDPHESSDRSRLQRRDLLAARAAQLFVDGRVSTVAEAIDAIRSQGTDEHDLRSLTHGRIRQHIEAMSMAKLGTDGVARHRKEILEVAEELMTLLDESLAATTTRLVGRAAAARLDGDVRLHLRAYTSESIAKIASLVVDAGHEEPRFTTAQTRFGRLDRIEFTDGPLSIVITRCRPEMIGRSNVDLHTGRTIAALDIDGVRKLIDEQRRDDATRTTRH